MRKATGLAALVMTLSPSCISTRTDYPGYDFHYARLHQDEERMTALLEFYEQSVIGIRRMDLSPQLVVLKTVHGDPKDEDIDFANGILLDDCGLILTNAHVARRVLNNKDTVSTAIFMDGSEYSALRTDLADRYRDFGMVVAETGKERRSHPLHFAPLTQHHPGKGLHYVACDMDYFRGITSSPSVERFQGKILTFEEAFELVMESHLPAERTDGAKKELTAIL
jgi:hypothetical protein